MWRSESRLEVSRRRAAACGGTSLGGKVCPARGAGVPLGGLGKRVQPGGGRGGGGSGVEEEAPREAEREGWFSSFCSDLPLVMGIQGAVVWGRQEGPGALNPSPRQLFSLLFRHGAALDGHKALLESASSVFTFFVSVTRKIDLLSLSCETHLS